MKLLLSLCLVLSLFNVSDAGILRPRVSRSSHHVSHVIYDQDRIVQKVVEFDNYAPIRVIAAPVTDYGPEYYWYVNQDSMEPEYLTDQGVISDADIDRIADAVIEKFTKEFDFKRKEGSDVPSEPVKPTASDLDEQVKALFVNHCATCHGDKASGGLQLLNKDSGVWMLNNIDPVTRWTIYDRTHGGANLDSAKRMPKNQEPLSDQDIELLQEWARSK